MKSYKKTASDVYTHRGEWAKRPKSANQRWYGEPFYQ